MATPEFVLALREHIGHELLWMPGVTTFVVDANARVCWLCAEPTTEPGHR